MTTYGIVEEIDRRIEAYEVEMKRLNTEANEQCGLGDLSLGASDGFYDYLKHEGSVKALRELRSFILDKERSERDAHELREKHRAHQHED